ncbi:MAG: Ig-like domain-containing protein [Bacteroidales bacterium]|nr:Ig-like domain-containing protein [Bacteroidales bacterium]
MQKRILYPLLGLAILGGLNACNNLLEENPQAGKVHTVYFTTNSSQTKTGITIEDKTVIPDWRKTDPVNIHLFEIGSSSEISVGEDIKIIPDDDYATAHFQADFPTEMTIIVDPNPASKNTAAKGTGSSGPYTYSAVVAQKAEEDLTFFVPAEQHPDAETLIDPAADFLIGFSRSAYETPHDYSEQVVDLYFDRPVALGRVSLTNFSGTEEKVLGVVIKAPGLSGSASYSAIDFENASVSFTPDPDADQLSLSYGNGTAVENGGFDAYFVVLPGAALISEIEVTTDQYVYTKSLAGGKEFTFKNSSFKDIRMDLSTADRKDNIPETVRYYEASALEDGLNYVIVSEGKALQRTEEGLAGIEVSASDGVLEITKDESLLWKAAAYSGAEDYGHFTLSNGEGNFLQRYSDPDTHDQTIVTGGIPSSVKYYVWDFDGSYLYQISSPADSRLFYCFYNESWTTTYEKNDAKTVRIYTTRAPQTLSFSESEVSYNLDEGGDFTAPSLSGAQTDVYYSSSNEAVATVDAATGEITFVGAGTTTITARAAGTDDLQGGEARYTLTVISGAVETFYLASEIQAGSSYIIVSEGSAIKVNGEELTSVSVTITDGAIKISASDVSLWLAEEHIEYYSGSNPAGHYTLSLGEKYLQRKSNKPAIGDIPDTKKYYVWEYDGEHLYHLSSASNTFYVGYIDGAWDCKYQSPYPNTYLFTNSPQRKPQTLSFSEESVSVILGTDSFTAPVLSGAQTTVRYSSSDATVATVDASDGTVSIVGVGTTTITATAEANEEYVSGKASYTLTVTDADAPTWYRTNEFKDGEAYLIISNGYALQKDGTAAAAVSIENAGETIRYSAPATLLWTATADGDAFTLTNGSDYLRRSSSSLTIGTKSGTASNNQWTVDGSGILQVSTSYYLYYSTSQTAWSISTSASSSHTAYLYGTTPPRTMQDLSFDNTTVEYDLSGDTPFAPPVLSGAQTNVTYASSKPDVATVDAETGAVEVLAVGMTVITATAEGTDTYQPASATYSLKVVDSSIPVTAKRYVLTDQIEDGKNYLIVSGGFALGNDNGSVSAAAVTPTDDCIEFDAGEGGDLVWRADKNTNPDYAANGDFIFSNEGYRLIRKSSSGSFSVAFAAESSSLNKYGVWLLQSFGGDSYLYHNSSSTMACFVYYDGGWKITYVSDTTDPSDSEKPTRLYVETEVEE